MNKTFKLPKSINRKIGKAMHDFRMLEQGDRVLVAVSGGVDSMVLAWILHTWQKKAPISYELHAVTVDNGYLSEMTGTLSPHESISSQMKKLGIIHSVVSAREINKENFSCYLCARNRRNQLFDMVREQGFSKIAFGHHKDDLLETFMLNVIYSGNISTMLPHQKLFNDSLGIIRPMAYLEKEQVEELAELVGLQPVKNDCPLFENTRREKVRSILAHIYKKESKAKKSMFAALSNVRDDYLLQNISMEKQ